MGVLRNGMKRILCAGLCITTLVGLTACGKGAVGESEVSGWGEDNTALAKEFVYAEQPIKLPKMEGSAGIQQITQSGEHIYAVYEIYGNEEAPESQFDLLSMNKDGSDVQLTAIQIDFDENEDNEQEYVGIRHFEFSSDEKLYAIKDYYQQVEDDFAADSDAEKTVLCCWDLNGTMLWEYPLDLQQPDESRSDVWKVLPMAGGDVGIVVGGNETELLVLSSEGIIKERKPLSAIDRKLANYSDIFLCENGTFMYTYIEEKQNSTMWLNSYDVANGTVGEPMQLPESFRSQGYLDITAGGDLADIIYTTSTGVFAFKKGDSEAKQLMSFINSDVPTTNMNHILLQDDTHFVGFYYDDYEHEQVASIFTKKNPEDIADKKVLVLAGYYVPYEVKSRVIQFNKTNPEYRVVIKEYHTYDTMEDGMAGYTQLNMDILGRGLPDILIADSYFPVSSYISKGLVADIGELIAADEELSKKEFMENVFDAYKVEGKLYYVIPSFSVRTLVGKTSIVGDRTSWTMQEMMELLDAMPEGTQAIGELTRSEFIDLVIQYCGSDFVDVATGKCNFNSENFVKMLEFAKTLPEEINWDEYGDDYWLNKDLRYRENLTILAECNVSSVRYVNDYINGYFGEDISYVGFPTDKGNGAVVKANEQYLISEKSENKEGAWEFVRYYLTDEYQRNLVMFPVDKQIFVEKANEATENPYTVDRYGNKQSYEAKFSIGGESVVLPNMNQDQVNTFVNYVESIDKCFYHDEDIESIISEEVASFFAGQKSAADVAGVIQSRVEIYVGENK